MRGYDGLRPYGSAGAGAAPRGAEAGGSVILGFGKDDMSSTTSKETALERKRSVRWIDAVALSSNCGSDKGAHARGGAPAAGTSPRKGSGRATGIFRSGQ